MKALIATTLLLVAASALAHDIKHEHGQAVHVHRADICVDEAIYPPADAVDYCQCGWNEDPNWGYNGTGTPGQNQARSDVFTHRHPWTIIHPQCGSNPTELQPPVVNPPPPVDPPATNDTFDCHAEYSVSGTFVAVEDDGNALTDQGYAASFRADTDLRLPADAVLALTMTGGDWDICIDDAADSTQCFGRSAICQSVNGGSSTEYVRFDGMPYDVWVNVHPWSEIGTWSLYRIEE